MGKIIDFLSVQSDLFLFTQTGFWLFFALVLGVHSIIYKKRVVRSLFLFVCSLFFYYKTGGYYFTLLIISTLIDYTIGLALGKAQIQWKRKLLVSISLIVNLFMLGYFKYSYFVMDTIGYIASEEYVVYDFVAHFFNQISGSQFSIDDIILPIGISFFTFQTISYSIDVYRKELMPVKNIIDFGFYVSFFPQLISGPIVRAKEFIPQIYQMFALSEKWMWHAIWLILGGLFKKMVISDYISVNFVDRVFENPITYSGFEIMMAIYGYALQIYCDFSGYTDIALGVGLLLGFRLPENFNFPYKATSLQDFWHRWHISLSKWLRDYLYIPLGGNRKGSFRSFLNLSITMVLGGLWHGASLKFVIWGFWHGLGLMINRAIKPIRLFKSRRFSKFVAWFITFHFVVLGWIAFRVDTISDARIIFHRLIYGFNASSIGDIILAFPYLYALIVFGFILHFIPIRYHKVLRLRFILLPWWMKIILSAFVIYLLSSLYNMDVQPFIYLRF